MIGVSRRQFAALAITCALATPVLVAASEWKVMSRVDALTDAENKSAHVFNADGHAFAVFRLPSGRVVGVFKISDRSRDVLSHDLLPVFRVDKNDAVNTRLRNASWEPKWVQFDIAGSNPSDRAVLASLMNGKQILFRYYRFTGGAQDTVFSLNGARAAIADALGMTDPDGPLPAALDAKARQEKAEGLCAALPEAARSTCQSKVSDCTNWYGNNPTAFRQCVEAHALQ